MSNSSLEEQGLRAIIEAYDAAWNRHALDAIIACHTVDSVFESHTTAETATGHDAIRRMIARYFRTFPDLAFTIRRMYARPGLVVQE
ncbi:MAG: nuclear transport factor 2 family protein, partial [Polyangia bacterium]